eukprot:m.17438 g.17438  ORF g.17438 m.17438 type:complete len:355 (-) comp6022_c0_seq1:156-1220(-)
MAEEEPEHLFFALNQEAIPEIDASKFKPQSPLKAHTEKVYSIAFNQVGDSLMSAAQDGKLIIWNPYTGTQRMVILPKSQWVLTCDLNNSGNLAASGGLNNVCSVYQVKNDLVVDSSQGQAELALAGHDGAILHCRFVPPPSGDNGSQIVTSSGDKTLRLWDVGNRKTLNTFKGHDGDVSSFEFLDTKNFVSISTDLTIKTWDVRSKEATSSRVAGSNPDTEDITSLAIFPDSNNQTFFTGSQDGRACLWDLRMQDVVTEYYSNAIWASQDQGSPPQVGVSSISLSKSGRLLFVGYYDVNDPLHNHILAWDTLCGNPVEEFRRPPPARIQSLTVSPDGNAVFCASWDKKIYKWLV